MKQHSSLERQTIGNQIAKTILKLPWILHEASKILPRTQSNELDPGELHFEGNDNPYVQLIDENDEHDTNNTAPRIFKPRGSNDTLEIPEIFLKIN